MQAVAGQYVGPPTEKPRGLLPHFHKLEQTELSALVVKKEIDIQILAFFTSRG